MHNERRSVPRFPVSIRVDAAQGETLGSGYAHTISEKGLGIDARAWLGQKIPCVGTELRLRFILPKTQTALTVLARVVRVENEKEESPQLAMEFVDLIPEAQRVISQFIALKKI